MRYNLLPVQVYHYLSGDRLLRLHGASSSHTVESVLSPNASKTRATLTGKTGHIAGIHRDSADVGKVLAIQLQPGLLEVVFSSGVMKRWALTQMSDPAATATK